MASRSLALRLSLGAPALAAAACAGTPEARLVTEVPDAAPVAGDAEVHEIQGGQVTVEADVKAGSSYTIRFPRTQGKIVVSPTAHDTSTIDVVVDTTSAEASWQLVADIARDQFLHVSSFPSARFTSRALRSTEAGLELFGDLEFHGTKKSLVVPVQIETDPCRIRLFCEFFINRRDFGAVSSGGLDGIVSDHVVVRIEGDLPRKAAPASCAEAEGGD